MTERPPPLRDPQPARAHWHHVDGMPTREKSLLGIGAPCGTNGMISSGAWEGC